MITAICLTWYRTLNKIGVLNLTGTVKIHWKEFKTMIIIKAFLLTKTFLQKIKKKASN